MSLDTIKKGLRNSNSVIALTAARCCQGKEIPLRTIKEWASSASWMSKSAALYACIGKSESEFVAIIQNALTDEDEFIRLLAQDIISNS